MTDIVEKLRDACVIDRHYGKSVTLTLDYDDYMEAAAEIERLRAALESTEAWLERWAVHVGRCEGGHSCTCGLTAAQYEGSAAIAHPAPAKEGNTNG